MQVLANNQLAATSGTLVAAVAGTERLVHLRLANTSGSTTETVVVTVAHGTDTARRIARVVLAPNETAVVPDIALGPTDVLAGSTTNATTVDYVVQDGPSLGGGLRAFDSTGSPKSASAVAATSTGTVGASTAGAGTTQADATILPAATGNIYPTTAADDTVGVKVNVADQVTGRTLFIGNGVSNKILKVYGPTGAVINGAAANAAFSTASGKGCWIVCLSGSGNTWLAA